MLSVKTTFQERVDEINTYFGFVIQYIPDSTDENLNKILKSNLILMLYNLVESSVSNAIEEIHNNMNINRVSFDLLNIELKKILFTYLKNNVSPQRFVENINEIAIDIVKQSFKKEKISNGNIDEKTINKLGRTYGFSCDTTYAKTKAGKCLAVIRGKRNDLAHGTYSFTEIGKEYTSEDLEKMKDEAINYLEEILINIESYLLHQHYKVAVAV